MRDLYIGLMSGTSMDGIDAALVRIGDDQLMIVETLQRAYPDVLQERLVAIRAQPSSSAIDDIGELDKAVGECFRDAALALLDAGGVNADEVSAIGSHGQTIRHCPDAAEPYSLQIGDGALIAAGTGIGTVADFRSADIALGGQGAPLVPPFHEWLFRDPEHDRVVLNIGGIANVTILPKGGAEVTGFDTGPGNTLMDAWIRHSKGEAFDMAGQWAASGAVDAALLDRLCGDPWFAAPPPKSTGFELFNLDWLLRADVEGVTDADVQATLAELTARTIGEAVTKAAPGITDVYVCGGGIHNAHLLGRLETLLPGTRIASTATVGLDPDWVEAAAFAWLAMRRINNLPGNLPSVTGASRPALLGVYFPA